MGPYVVDFFCPEAKLIVEVDGGQHADDAERDALRTRWLETRGYRVIRFWNNEVLANAEGVLRTILGMLRAYPPPARGRRPRAPAPSRGAGPKKDSTP